MYLVLMAIVGGGLGAGARFLVNAGVMRLAGPAFPWGTLLINVSGCLAMGIAVEVITRRFGGSAEARAFFMSGILGGYTTFSAFALDVAGLANGRELVAATAYVAGSVVLSIAALYAGLALARWAFP